MNFQHKVVNFSSSDMTIFDAMLINMQEKYVIISPSEKWKFCAPYTLQKLLITHDRLPLRHMAKKMVTHVSGNKIIAHFQV